jgi:thiol-disulfide isomerase/thioredoxin
MMELLESRGDYDAVAAGSLSVVAFLATWSRPSKQLEPLLTDLASKEEYEAAKFCTVDMESEEGAELALELGVEAPPTVFILRRGGTMEQFAAIKDVGAVGAAIARLAGLDAEALDAEAAEKQRAFIRERYGNAADARSSGAAGGPGGCGGSAPQAIDPGDCDFASMAETMGYSTEQVKQIGNLGLGCGNPFTDADITGGETVLDLGSGAGFDCFLASKMVGESGSVIGVDMTPKMVSLARANATDAVRAGDRNHILASIPCHPASAAPLPMSHAMCVGAAGPGPRGVRLRGGFSEGGGGVDMLRCAGGERPPRQRLLPTR